MLRWTDAQLAAYQALQRGQAEAKRDARPVEEHARPKYRNKKTEIQGVKFDSKAEASRFVQLRRMQEAGLIEDLRRQVSFELIPKNGHERACKYISDFVYIDQNGEMVVEDVKSSGTITKDFVIKRKLMLFIHKITIRVVKNGR